MAKKSRATFQKREKERARQQKQHDKAQRRVAAKTQSRPSPPPPADDALASALLRLTLRQGKPGGGRRVQTVPLSARAPLSLYSTSPHGRESRSSCLPQLSTSTTPQRRLASVSA